MKKNVRLMIALLVVVGFGAIAFRDRPTTQQQNSEAEQKAVNALVTQLSTTSVIKDLQVASFAADSGNLKTIQAASLTITETTTLNTVGVQQLTAASIASTALQSNSLAIRGSAAISGTLSAGALLAQDATVASLTSTESAHVQGAATVDGSITTGGNLTVSGAVIVAGDASLQGDVSISKALEVEGSTTMGALSASSATITGNTTIGGTAAITGNTSITGAASIGGNTTIDTDTLVVDAASNRVGVGSNAPTAKFHVKGNSASTIVSILQTAASQTADVFQVRDSSNSILARITSTGAFQSESASPSYIIGDTGIGTNDPWSKLHVNIGGGAATDIAETMSGYGTNGQLTQLWYNYASGGTAWYIVASADGSGWGPQKFVWYDSTSDKTPLTLHGASGKVSVNGFATPSNTLGVNGTIGASGSITANSTPDIAETITAAPDVEAADVVSADPHKREAVVKSQGAYDSTVLGVISDGTSAFMINAYSHVENGPLTGKPLVLAGRVPVKVTNEGGAIRPGDYLTASSTPGKAMKATKAGPTIGKALAWFDGDSGTVLALINVSYYDPSATLALQGTKEADFTKLNVSGPATLASLKVTGDVQISGTLKVKGHLVSAGDTASATTGSAAGTDAQVTIDGNDTAGTITITIGASGSTEGILANVNFTKTYSKSPRVSLTPANREASTLHYFRSSTTSSFAIETSDTPPAGTTYVFDYFVIE